MTVAIIATLQVVRRHAGNPDRLLEFTPLRPYRWLVPCPRIEGPFLWYKLQLAPLLLAGFFQLPLRLLEAQVEFQGFFMSGGILRPFPRLVVVAER